MSDFRRTDLVRVSGRLEAGDHLYVVRKVEVDDFTGVRRISAHPLLPRLFVGRDAPPVAQDSLLPEELTRLPSPSEALEGALSQRGEAWPTRTRQAIERLYSLWLLHEDRKRLLDAATVDQLAHQVSLLEYVKQKDLRRLLIADEVGLGKTVEAGLLIQWALEANPAARVLYLAPAMLVDNVYGELKRMEVPARIDRYSASISSISNPDLKEAQVIIASIHRAAYERNMDYWRESSGAWDVLIVDECHHASDWSEDGSSPMKQMRLVRDLVERRLKPGGRLVLMSATPHQGNENKFRNLLRLLSDEGYKGASGSLQSVAGRVVYRTKEDVRDWDGQPLFSKRKVNEPTYVQLGPEYHAWLAEISDVFEGAESGAASWRKAQALQWAASSPKAGLAYLTRLALRSGFDFDRDPVLWDVAKVLLPYRGLPADAPVAAVRQLLEKQSGKEQSIDDEDDVVFSDSPINRIVLKEAIQRGLGLMRSDAMQTKLAPLLKWVEDEAPSKFVVFASPIETVDELRLGLERLLGAGSVVTISGAMEPYERRTQMQAFRGANVRALVASKAGSEGINLQVSHRLVHFDVPWNPMEMEQRVGRVHRYGSTRTVVVDTIVVQGSREERMLRRCRARLAQIVEQLFGPGAREGSRFEEMYSRVMTQVPAEELAEIVASEGFLSDSSDRLDELVQAGFQGWKASDEALRQGADPLVKGIPDRGNAREADMEGLFELLDAAPEAGWLHVRLAEKDGERIEETVPARVWAFPTEGANVRRVADRVSSLSVRGPAGFQGFVERAGLNLPNIAAKVRELVGGAHQAVGRSPRGASFLDGAGAIRVPDSDWRTWAHDAGLTDQAWNGGGILLAWTVRLLHRGTPTELWTGVQTYLMRPDRTGGTWLAGAQSADLFRLFWRSRRRQNLVLPPHKRTDALGFDLVGLSEDAAKLAPEVLRQAGEFDPTRHDFELVPVAALTIEPRKDIDIREIADAEARDDTFTILDTSYRPSPDFLEKVLTGLATIPTVRSPGDSSVYVLLIAEPARLASSDPNEHALAFGVYVGTTEQNVVDRYEQHRDPEMFLHASSLNWEGVEPVGIVRLDQRFSGISQDGALALERDVADALRRQGLRVLGGH